MKKVTAILTGVVLTATFAGAQELFDVYETRISARTSVVREMTVRVIDKNPANTKTFDKQIPLRVHFRAPVTKNYTVLVAYKSSVSDAVRNTDRTTAFGYMWSNDREPAFVIGGETVNAGNPIGTRGLNYPVYSGFTIASARNETLDFEGVATEAFNRKDNFSFISAIAGTVEGTNFLPIPHRARDGSVVAADQGHVLPALTEKITGSKAPHYPDLCEVEVASVMVPEEVHFHGSYTTRWNTALTNGLAKYMQRQTGIHSTDQWEALKKSVNERVPLISRPDLP